MKRLVDPLREDKSSLQMARETAQVMFDIASAQKYQTIGELVKTIKRAEKMIVEENPLEFTVQNVVRRILAVLQQANEEGEGKKHGGFSDLKRLFQKDENNEDSQQQQPQNVEDKEAFKLQRIKVVEGIEQLIQEIDSLNDSLAQFATNHINSREIILTYGYSETMRLFLGAAKQEREFDVVVLEGEQKQTGSKMVQELAKEGITATLIPFAAAFAFMPRVSKVFLGAHAIMKNGGMLSRNGTLMLATAAKAFSVPVVVLASSVKLTPHFPFEQNTFNEVLNPSEVLPDKVAMNDNETVVVTRFDYVAPEYVSLYLTDKGEHTPAYIYRLFNEYYL